jgi:hypothetical protein
MTAMNGVKIEFPTLSKPEFYPQWAKGMEYALKASNLWKLIVLPPTPNEEAQSFQVMSILHNKVAPHMQIRVGMCSTPKEAWEEIKKNCLGANEIFEDTLRINLATLKKGAKEDIETYFSRALQIRENFGQCGVYYNDKQLLFHVFHGLPEEFEMVRSTLQYAKGGVSVAEAQSVLTDFESRRKMLHEETAMYAKQQVKFRGTCNKCGEKGHSWSYCPKPDANVDEQQQQYMGSNSNSYNQLRSNRNYQQYKGFNNHQKEIASKVTKSAFAGIAKLVNHLVQEELAKPAVPVLAGVAAVPGPARAHFKDVYEIGY